MGSPSFRVQPCRPTACRMPRLLLVVCVALSLSAGPAHGDETGAPLPPPGKWLVDYGMVHGLLVTNPTPGDAAFVLAWLDAATFVSPDLAEAHLWKYDLLTRLSRADEAYQALQAYCRCVPKDLSARLNLIDVEYQRAQTVEQRIDVCQGHLQAEDVPPEIASDLHRRLAQLYFGSADDESARRHAELAIQFLPQNLPARTLMARIDGRLDEPATRIQLLLDEISINPLSADLLWRLAKTLDSLSMHDDALSWYDATVEAFADRAPGSHPPPTLLYDLAESHFNHFNDAETITCCNRILAQRPANVESAMLLIRAARRSGQNELADQQAKALAARLEKNEAAAIERHEPSLCRMIAEFHLDVEPNPLKALQFALLADRYEPGNPQTRLALGSAYLESGDPEEAVTVLTPLASRDQRAALSLARAQVALGLPDAARQALRTGEAIRAAGHAYEQILKLLAELGERPAPVPDRSNVAAVLSGFDRRVLQFATQVAEVLDFRVELTEPTCRFGRPIEARFSLDNRGPYPITLGQDRMIQPRVSVSFADTSFQGLTLQNETTITLGERYVLNPGERMDVSSTLTIPADKLLVDTKPQRRTVIEVTFILDPVLSNDGILMSALAGLEPISRRVTRMPVDASESGLKELADVLTTGSETERLAALDTLFALTIERHASMLDRPHTYAAVVVDADQLTELLRRTLDDPSPMVRTHAMCALLRLPLGEREFNAAARLISDPHWLPRMVAAEMFTKLQGPVFLPVLERLTHDPNPTVALVARLRHMQVTQTQEARESVQEAREQLLGKQR